MLFSISKPFSFTFASEITNCFVSAFVMFVLLISNRRNREAIEIDRTTNNKQENSPTLPATWKTVRTKMKTPSTARTYLPEGTRIAVENPEQRNKQTLPAKLWANHLAVCNEQ